MKLKLVNSQGHLLMKILFISFFLLVDPSSANEDYNLDIFPDVSEPLKGLEGVRLNFTLTLTPLTSSYPDNVKVFLETNAKYFHFEKEDVDDEFSHQYDEGNFFVVVKPKESRTLYFNSSLIGIYYIRFYTEINGIPGTKDYFHDNSTLHVVIGRDKAQLNTGINIGFTLILVIALFFMGLEIDLKLVLKVLKRPIGPTIGMVCQFLFMPICAYALGELFLEQDYEKLGLLLLGSSPGGAPSNFWTAMFKGDINLSVTMTLLSSVASFAMTSLWVYVFGRGYADKNIDIPYHMIALSLVSFVIPMGIGVFVKHKRPRMADRIQTLCSRPFFLICLIVFPSVGTANNLFFFYLVTWRHLISGFLLGALGYAFGAGLAWICRQDKPQIIAISLETAIQNGGIAFVVLNLTFDSPYSDVGVIPVISFFFCSTGPIMFVVYAAYEAYRCATGQNSIADIKKKLREVKRTAKGDPAEDTTDQGTELKDFSTKDKPASENDAEELKKLNSNPA